MANQDGTVLPFKPRKPADQGIAGIHAMVERTQTERQARKDATAIDGTVLKNARNYVASKLDAPLQNFIDGRNSFTDDEGIAALKHSLDELPEQERSRLIDRLVLLGLDDQIRRFVQKSKIVV